MSAGSLNSTGWTVTCLCGGTALVLMRMWHVQWRSAHCSTTPGMGLFAQRPPPGAHPAGELDPTYGAAVLRADPGKVRIHDAHAAWVAFAEEGESRHTRSTQPDPWQRSHLLALRGAGSTRHHA